MKVSELIDKLNFLPEDAEIRVLIPGTIGPEETRLETLVNITDYDGEVVLESATC